MTSIDRSGLNGDSLTDIIDHYGTGPQLVVAIEELAELIKELTKTIRGFHNTEAICEEIADVLVILSQLYIIYNIDDDDIKEICAEKVWRTRLIIADEDQVCHDYHQDDGTPRKVGSSIL